MPPERSKAHSVCDSEMDMKIVLIGKTGDGKSSSANTILGEEFFEVNNGPSAVTTHCSSKLKMINGRKIKVVDTPGFFDICRPEEEIKSEIVRCIAECSPGPHAFVLVLKAERYTLQEREIVNKITETFGEDALKYTVVLFTRGDQLNKGQTEYVDKNEELKRLIQKCGGRYHVIDNKYWKPENNSIQVEKLLNTIEEMVRENGGGCYTNDMLQAVDDEIQTEMREILSENINESINVREEAVNRVTNKLLVKCAGVGAGALLGAFLGVGTTAALAVIVGITAGELLSQSTTVSLAEFAGKATAAAGGIGTAAGAVVGISAVGGAIGGGIVGAQAAEGALTAGEAARKAVKANLTNAKSVVDTAKKLKNEIKEAFNTPNDPNKQGFKKLEYS
ncbi:GTPase IMAP family member 7-like [Alosa sapidissima]|uniref:GTPase IMAP family member 7-like n=1 Tax=Alosa sapidissima TaxID=34773 RepID=UPI001C08F430|nr:GTPase IMAP family member 7-like [Alosa sapidissima]